MTTLVNPSASRRNRDNRHVYSSRRAQPVAPSSAAVSPMFAQFNASPQRLGTS